MFADLVLGASLFAATNVDDLFVLVGFFAERRVKPRHVVIGQYAGILALTAVSVVAALVSLVVPREVVGLLGLAPIGIGLKKWWELRSPDDADDSPPAASGILSVAAVTVANGGDNIGVYVPVFATRTVPALISIVVVFVVMTALWCAAAYALVNHPKLGAPIRRFGKVVLPFVLIGIGVSILYEARVWTSFTA